MVSLHRSGILPPASLKKRYTLSRRQDAAPTTIILFHFQGGNTILQRLCDIITARELTENVFALTLEAGELGRMAAPGQFLHIKCGDGVLLRRPISICDARDGYLKIVFRSVGPGTHWLSEQKSG